MARKMCWLGLLLIVLAFTRPFHEMPQAAAAPGRVTRANIILIDNSLSMGYGDRWDRAKKAAETGIGVPPSSR